MVNKYDDLELVKEELCPTCVVLDENRRINMSKLLALRHTEAKEKQKVKRIWQEKCEQMHANTQRQQYFKIPGNIY